MGRTARRFKRHGQKPVRASPTVASSGHAFIRIGRYHRSQHDAEAYVLGMFRAVYPGIDLEAARCRVIRDDSGGKAFSVSFRSAVQAARARGTAENLRTYLTAGEPHAWMSMGLATDGEGAGAELAVSLGSAKLRGPARVHTIEDEFANDILEHRRGVAVNSSFEQDAFRASAMHFRAYVLTSCALVEAFLNRAVLVAASEPSPSVEIEELLRPCAMERRFELWLQEFCKAPLSALRHDHQSKWSSYQALRKLRNELVHPSEVWVGFHLKQGATQLNLVREGVGGVINVMRRLQKLGPLAYAERLETAPRAEYVPRPKE